jgi:hypothetical protein
LFVFDANAFFVRFLRAMDGLDFATLQEMVHPDLTSDSPQSGERTRGFDAFRAQMEQYPGGGAQNPLQSRESRLLEEENRRLRQENARLREEREILKKAAAFFAKDAQ